MNTGESRCVAIGRTGSPAPLRSSLKDHTVRKTKDIGWDTLSTGELLRAAEDGAFEIFVTTDKTSAPSKI